MKEKDRNILIGIGLVLLIVFGMYHYGLLQKWGIFSIVLPEGKGDLDGNGIIDPPDLNILRGCIEGVPDDRCTLEVADLDDDGVIGPPDLNILRTYLIQQPVPILGDLDGDGVVSPADLNILRQCIQGIEDERCILETGDLTNDGVIGPDDINAMIILLGGDICNYDGICDLDETLENCPDDCSLTIIENCSDGIQNQDETGIDCGGVCPACPVVTAPSGGGGSSYYNIYNLTNNNCILDKSLINPQFSSTDNIYSTIEECESHILKEKNNYLIWVIFIIILFFIIREVWKKYK